MLIEYLKTGKLGRLELGMQVEDVLDYLGLPPYTDKTRTQFITDLREHLKTRSFDAFSLYYKSLELIFTCKTLDLISISIKTYGSYPFELPQLLELNTPVYKMTPNQFVDLVIRNDIECFKVIPKVVDIDIYWVKSSYVKVAFDKLEGEAQFSLTLIMNSIYKETPCVLQDCIKVS